MNIWDVYQSRIEAKGGTKRNAKLVRESRFLSTKADENLSRFEVEIDGVLQETFIINTDNLNEKFIYSMPGEDIRHGGLVSWMNNFWLITEKDAANELYTRAKMIQCNYLLRWVGLDHSIHEQWCIVEDGTKYLTGEYEDRDYIVTRGDSRLGLTIARNAETAKFDRDRRFLIDDPDSAHMLAYQLTKPFKLGGVYNGDFSSITISYTTSSGYELDSLIVNGTSYTDGVSLEVSSAITIIASSKAQGLVYIYTGSGFEAFQVYIYNGSSWDLYCPYVYRHLSV